MTARTIAAGKQKIISNMKAALSPPDGEHSAAICSWAAENVLVLRKSS
jgi:hypothetical protein